MNEEGSRESIDVTERSIEGLQKVIEGQQRKIQEQERKIEEQEKRIAELEAAANMRKPLDKGGMAALHTQMSIDNAESFDRLLSTEDTAQLLSPSFPELWGELERICPFGLPSPNDVTSGY